MMWKTGTSNAIIIALGLGVAVGVLVTGLLQELGWISIVSFLGALAVVLWLSWSERHSLAKKFRVETHVAVGIVRRVLKEEGLSFRQDGSTFLIDSTRMKVRIWVAYRRRSFDRFGYSRVIIGPDIERDQLLVNRLRECFDEAFKDYGSFI